MAEEWAEKVFEVQRVSNRIILVKLRSACGYLSVCFIIICPTEWSKVMRLRSCSLISCNAMTARIPGSNF